MKRVALASVLISVGAFAACSAEPTTNPGTGGTGMTGTGGAGGSGISGASGTTMTGGASGTASGGASGTGTGGTPITGGTGGDGTMTGGTGGNATGGTGLLGGSGNDGGMGNMGGMGLVGGAMTGGTGGSMGGMGGKAMGGSGGTTTACASITDLFNTDRRFDGRLTETPCAISSSNDCTGGGWRLNGGALTGCANNRLDANQTIMVGGVSGQNYAVTLHFYGIMEPKNYGGNVRRQSNSRPTNNPDATCAGTGHDKVCGATPPPFAYRVGTGATACQEPACYDGSDYNSYEIHVKNPAGQEVCSYFLNSDTMQGHWTFSIDYSRTINVIGGGSIRIRSYDSNCRMIKNCANNSTTIDCSTEARSVNVSAAMPAPANLQQPGLGLTGKDAGQWFLIDVTNVACTGMTPPTDCAPFANPTTAPM